MLTKAEADAAVKLYGGQRAAAKALHISRSTLQDALKRTAATNRQSKQPTKPARVGKALMDFRREYDKDFIIPRKIKAALVALGAGWMYEMEFCKLAGVSLMDLGHVREQFKTNVVLLDRGSRRAWAGKASVADAMRKML
jgi:hypothetical protein